MARSSSKGFYFCKNTFRVIFKQHAENLDIVSHYMRRASTIPNVLALIVPRVESGSRANVLSPGPYQPPTRLAALYLLESPMSFLAVKHAE